MDEHTRVNRKFWDEVSPHHAASDFYDVESFINGADTLGAIESAELGDLSGQRMVHLQCHIGLDTLSWARRGVDVTGVDFSPASSAIACDLARRTELSAHFVEADVYAAADVLGDTYDIVFTSRGVLMWLGDLPAWARTCAALLRPGGTFYLLDIHPLSMALEQTDSGLHLASSYFGSAEPDITREDRSYAVHDVGLANQETHEWIHPVGEVVSALIDAGIVIDFLREWPTDDCAPTTLSADDVHAGVPQLPGLFSVRGHRA
jgi:SAM-dependent methyltransferase